MADALDIPTEQAPPPEKGIGFGEMMKGLTDGTIDPETRQPIDKAPPVEKAPEKKPDTVVEKKETTAKRELPKGVFTEPKKAEADPEMPEFKDPKRAADWNKLREDRDNYKKWREENEPKLTKLGESEKRIAELEEKVNLTTKERAEWETLVSQARIDLHPEFRRKYVDGRNALVEEAKTVARDSGIEPSELENAMRLTGKARADALAALTEGLPTYQVSQIGEVVSQISRLDREADAKRSDAKATWETMQREDGERQRTQREQQIREFQTGWETATKELPANLEVLNETDVPWWNDQKKDILTNAQNDYQNNRDPKRAAELCVKAHAMEAYRSMFLDTREELASVRSELEAKEAELKKFYSASPGAGGQNRGGGGDAKKQGFVESFTNALTGQ